jgi:hypothetical protein
MPIMATTIISSMSVKPFWINFISITPLRTEGGAHAPMQSRYSKDHANPPDPCK